MPFWVKSSKQRKYRKAPVWNCSQDLLSYGCHWCALQPATFSIFKSILLILFFCSMHQKLFDFFLLPFLLFLLLLPHLHFLLLLWFLFHFLLFLLEFFLVLLYRIFLAIFSLEQLQLWIFPIFPCTFYCKWYTLNKVSYTNLHLYTCIFFMKHNSKLTEIICSRFNWTQVFRLMKQMKTNHSDKWMTEIVNLVWSASRSLDFVDPWQHPPCEICFTTILISE